VRPLAIALLAVGMLALAPQGSMQMRLDGRWEIVRRHADGRFEGASVRSYHAGDVLAINLSGVGFRIYGVTGPTGGHAVIVMNNTPVKTIDFFSPTKRTDVLLYASPVFPRGSYDVDLVVAPIHDAPSRGTYVNIDKVEVIP
jgi:hypothetical protein